MTIQGGPYNLIAGSTVDLPDPTVQQRGQYPWVAIFNSSTEQLQITDDTGNFRYLQPNTADVWKMSSSGAPLRVTQSTPVAVGTYLGTISAIYYTDSDDEPKNYPFPLVAFPGGYAQVANLIVKNGAPVTVDIEATLGANAFTIQFLNVNQSGTAPPNVIVTGVQTGFLYGDIAYPGPNLVGLLGAIDTSYALELTQGAGTGTANYTINVFATSVEVPTYPIDEVAGTANVTITAAAGQTIYLFSADVENSNNTVVCGWEFVDTLGNFVGALSTNVKPDANGDLVTNTVDFSGLRCQPQIDVDVNAISGSGGGRIIVRYALGP